MMQGIQSLGPGVAEKMAAMGRFEDDQIAHVAEGEVIVPAPIIKYYPEVKKQVFDAMKDQGLDPEQFIVGGEMVAINPNTGVQEFGFLSKAFKKIKKIVKKAAPLLIAAALPGVGAALGTGLFAGTGITGAAINFGVANAADTALKGGNLREVMKAGAKGAATGAVTAGIAKGIGSLTGPAEATPDFLAEAEATKIPGLDTPPEVVSTTSTASTAGQNYADVIKGSMDQASTSTATGTQVVDASGATGTMTDASSFSPSYTPSEQKMLDQFRSEYADEAAFRQQFEQAGIQPEPSIAQRGIEAIESGEGLTYNRQLVSPANPARQLQYDLNNLDPNLVADAQAQAASFQVPEGIGSLPGNYQPPGTPITLPDGTVVVDAGGQAVMPDGSAALKPTLGETIKSIPGKAVQSVKDYPGDLANRFVNDPFGTTLDTAFKGSILYGMAGGGGDDDQGEQTAPGTVSGEDLQSFLNNYDYQGQQYAGLYYNPETQQYQDVPYVPNSGIVTAYAGGHIRGPGTGTSDSIPAYLSDGEFVMTADAVKGAGGGDREKGAAKMYAMMNKFEGMA